MTDVEGSSTAGAAARTRAGALAVSAVVALVVSSIAIVSSGGRPAGAAAAPSAAAPSPTPSLEQDGAILDQTDQQFLEALARYHAVELQSFYVQLEINRDRQQIVQDQASLRSEAVHEYTNVGQGSSLASLFSQSAEEASAAGEYQHVATGDLTDTVDNLRQSQASLTTEEAQLQSQAQQAKQAMDTATTAQKTAFEATLAERAINPDAGKPGSGGPPNPWLIMGPTPAARAIAAAKTQLGVPYLWGAESPGSGFDCSGLIQWAWGEAGVSLPRTSQGQYAATRHIPMADLQPGDLVFYEQTSDGPDHVVMYLGGGMVIQAPASHGRVDIIPMWSSGLVGASRLS